MKDFFNIKRFGKYMAYDLGKAYASSGLSLLITALLPVLTFLLIGFMSIIAGRGWISADSSVRMGLAAVAIIIAFLFAPAKIYGHITDKKFGPDFVLLPASVFEKVASMLIILLGVFPLAFFAVMFCADGVMSLLFQDYGDTIFSVISTRGSMVGEVLNDFLHFNGFGLIWQAWAGYGLIFLIGALYFKKNKTAKTILTLIGLMLVLSAIFMPVMGRAMLNGEQPKIIGFLENILYGGDITAEKVAKAIKWISSIITTIYLTGLAVWTYFRVKTIKH